MEDLHRCYEILDLPPDAPMEEVKRSYRDMVSIWHPDRFTGNPRLRLKAEEKLKSIIAAHECIMEHLSSAEASRNGRSLSRGNNRETAGTSTPPSADTSPLCHAPAMLDRFVSFLGSLPNLLFVFFCVMCFSIAVGRFGLTIHALFYTFEILLIPLAFAFTYNVIAKDNQLLARLYVGFTIIAALVALCDSAMSSLESFEPGPPGTYPASTDGYRTYERSFPGNTPSYPGAASQPIDSEGEKQQSPQMRAPLAPIAPNAPLAPAAPVVPRAR